MAAVELSEPQLECLRRIASETGATAPCAEEVLQSLLRLGLIEHCCPRWLPLQQTRPGYQLSAQGQTRLSLTGDR